MLLVPTLKCLMIGIYHHGLKSDMARPFPERAHNGISLLLPRGPRPTLALRQDSTPKGHRDMRSIALDLLEDCPQGIVRGVRAQHKSLVRLHQEKTQLTQ